MTTVKADLGNIGAEDRGLFDEIKETGSEFLDLFSGVDQSDVAAGRVDLSELPREDRIALLVDGSTASVFGSSPWAIGSELDASVASDVHAKKGATLVFGVKAGFIDAAERALVTARYALVWDDTIVAEHGNLDVSPLGETFLVVGIGDEPTGKRLTLWITDDDLKTRILKVDSREALDKVRKDVIGEIGAAGDKDPNPIVQIANDITGFLTATQIGGVVALAVVAVVLVVLIRSEAFKDVASVAAKAVK